MLRPFFIFGNLIVFGWLFCNVGLAERMNVALVSYHRKQHRTHKADKHGHSRSEKNQHERHDVNRSPKHHHRKHQRVGSTSIHPASLLQDLVEPLGNSNVPAGNTAVGTTGASDKPYGGYNTQPLGAATAVNGDAKPQVTAAVAPNAPMTTPDKSEAVTQTTENAPEGGEQSGDLLCKLLWFFFERCNNPNTSETDVSKATQGDGNSSDNQLAPLAVAPTCKIFGTRVLSLSDFKDAEDKGWLLISESNSPRITQNKQINLDAPARLELKDVMCNAATYEATIKLGVDSSGGFIIRGTEENSLVLELNTLTKTATVKKITGPYQDIISEVDCDQINSQFIQKVQIRDTGYKGIIDIQIDGKKVISITNVPFSTVGSFGLYISQGNATFGDLSVVPISE